MKNIAKIAIVVAVISIIVGIISRVTMTPIAAIGLEAGALLNFASTCLLLAIALLLLEK